MGDIVLGTELLKPVGASSSRSNYDIVGIESILLAALFNNDTCADAVVYNKVLTFKTKKQFNAVITQIVLNSEIDILRLFGAEVTDRTIDKLQTCLNSILSYLFNLFLVADALDLIVCAEVKIYLIGIIYSLLSEVLSDKGRQISANLIGKGKLSV